MQNDLKVSLQRFVAKKQKSEPQSLLFQVALVITHAS